MKKPKLLDIYIKDTLLFIHIKCNYKKSYKYYENKFNQYDGFITTQIDIDNNLILVFKLFDYEKDLKPYLEALNERTI